MRLTELFIYRISPELVGFRDFRSSLHSDGTVSYNFPTLTESVCTLDVDRFPFDQQTCPLVFGSWVYDGTQMDLVVRIMFLDLQQNQDVFNSVFFGLMRW